MNIVQAARLTIKGHRREYTAKDGTKYKCVHEDGCYPLLGTVVGNYDPKLVIELGTSWGGLTKFFEDYAPNARIFSFDRPGAGRKPDEGRYEERVRFIRENVLDPPSPQVMGLLAIPCKKLLYCDNGCKIREVNTYAMRLHRGNLLGVHDWPREIYTDYGLLKSAARRHIEPVDIATLTIVLESFTPVWHQKFLEGGFSTRFWIRR